MKKGFWGFMAMGFMLAAWLLAAVPAGAQSVDNKIKALEEELGRLKAEQDKVKSEQLELKREATAAAAALPTFTYRTGFLGITAADKSWQISFSHEFHAHMYNWVDGNDSDGFTTGDIFLRRNRPFIYYCWEDCLYEIGWGADMDDGDITASQTSLFRFNFDQLNPYFPSLEISDKGNQAVSYVSRSSSSSARLELTRDLLSDSGYDTLSHAAIGVGWLNTPVWTGDFMLWSEMRVGAGYNQNVNSDTDRKQWFLKAGTRPFSKTKSKWLQRLKVGIGWTSWSTDDRSSAAGGGASNKRLRLRTDDRIGRIALMDTGGAVPIGGGLNYALFPGAEWGVGPYLFRVEAARSFYDNKKNPILGGNDIQGWAWSLQNELFVWSPKGFLTGTANTRHAVQLGFSFARADMDCGTGADCVPGASTSSKGHMLQKQFDVWYYIRPGLSVGGWMNFWSTPNMPTTLQRDVGCVKNTANASVGRDCDWYSLNLGLRANF
jgi:hypothetical protein